MARPTTPKTKTDPRKSHGTYLLSGGFLVCGDCGANFEAYAKPWARSGEPVYICPTRRRKPGTCRNTVALPMYDADMFTLDVLDADVLTPDYVETLLLAVSEPTVDHRPELEAERARPQGELDRLVTSIASGVPPETLAPAIQERQRALTAVTQRLQAPRPEPANIEQLRAALYQRVSEWREVLRGEVRVARLLVRKLLDPIVIEPRPEGLPEGPEDSYIRWETPVKPAILEGLAGAVHLLASPTGFEPVFQP